MTSTRRLMELTLVVALILWGITATAPIILRLLVVTVPYHFVTHPNVHPKLGGHRSP